MNGNAVQAAENPAERGADRMEETQATPATSSGSGGSNGKVFVRPRNALKTLGALAGAGAIGYGGYTLGNGAMQFTLAKIGEAMAHGAAQAVQGTLPSYSLFPAKYFIANAGIMLGQSASYAGALATKATGSLVGYASGKAAGLPVIGGVAAKLTGAGAAASALAASHPVLMGVLGGLAAVGAGYGMYKAGKAGVKGIRKLANGIKNKYRQWRHNAHMNYVRRRMLDDPATYQELGVVPQDAVGELVSRYEQRISEYEQRIEEMEEKINEQTRLIEQLSQGINEGVDGSEKGDNKDSINSEKETPEGGAEYVRNGTDTVTHDGGSETTDGRAERLTGTYAVDMFPEGAVVYRLGEYTNGERTVRLWEKVGGSEAVMVIRALQEGNRDGLTIYVNNRLSGMQAVLVGGMPYTVPSQPHVPVAYVPAGGCSGCNIFANQAFVYPRGVVGMGSMASAMPVTGMQYASPMASPLVGMQQQVMI